MATTADTDPGAVDRFVDGLADGGKRGDTRTLIDLGQRVTGEPPAMWGKSIIGFGSYHYRYDSGHEGDAALFGFSPRAKAFTLYLSSGPIETFQPYLDRLGKHRTGVGCLYINRLADIDEAVLADLVAASVEARRAMG